MEYLATSGLPILDIRLHDIERDILKSVAIVNVAQNLADIGLLIGQG